MEYPLVGDSRTAKDRFTSEEKRALDRLHNDIYNEVRHAAEVHRQVCCWSNYKCNRNRRVTAVVAKNLINYLLYQEMFETYVGLNDKNLIHVHDDIHLLENAFMGFVFCPLILLRQVLLYSCC